MLRLEARIPADSHTLNGELIIPGDTTGIVLFAHGSGSSRLSPRNLLVAEIIRAAGMGTLLFDLLTPEEEARDASTAELRFDIGLLAERLVAASVWARDHVPEMRLGYFGASTGAAAALVAAAETGDAVGAIVSRGGRPDLAREWLARVRAPTLLIVGSLDDAVIRLNQEAYQELECEKQFTMIPGAGHLFEEPGTLDQAARLAADWFQRHLGTTSGEAIADERRAHRLAHPPS